MIWCTNKPPERQPSLSLRSAFTQPSRKPEPVCFLHRLPRGGGVAACRGRRPRRARRQRVHRAPPLVPAGRAHHRRHLHATAARGGSGGRRPHRQRHGAPRPSRLAPRVSPLAFRPSRFAPRVSPLAFRPSPLAPRPSRFAPRVSPLAPWPTRRRTLASQRSDLRVRSLPPLPLPPHTHSLSPPTPHPPHTHTSPRRCL